MRTNGTLVAFAVAGLLVENGDRFIFENQGFRKPRKPAKTAGMGVRFCGAMLARDGMNAGLFRKNACPILELQRVIGDTPRFPGPQ